MPLRSVLRLKGSAGGILATACAVRAYINGLCGAGSFAAVVNAVLYITAYFLVAGFTIVVHLIFHLSFFRRNFMKSICETPDRYNTLYIVARKTDAFYAPYQYYLPTKGFYYHF